VVENEFVISEDVSEEGTLFFSLTRMLMATIPREISQVKFFFFF